MDSLTSLKNPKVMAWRSLKERKGRRETGCFLVEGRKMVEEALASAFSVETLLVSESHAADFSLPEDVPAYLLPDHVFAALCNTKTPQGISAVVRMRTAPVTGSCLLALDDVQDPGNVGTILRTADAAGFDGVLLSDKCADIFSPKVLRATMGSIFRMPVEITDQLPLALHQLKEEGWSILSSQLDGTPFFRREPVGDRFCLIIGNEGNGISPSVQAEATHKLRLPMRGGAESLNAAIAAGIMMYDLMRDKE